MQVKSCSCQSVSRFLDRTKSQRPIKKEEMRKCYASIASSKSKGLQIFRHQFGKQAKKHSITFLCSTVHPCQIPHLGVDSSMDYLLIIYFKKYV